MGTLTQVAMLIVILAAVTLVVLAFRSAWKHDVIGVLVQFGVSLAIVFVGLVLAAHVSATIAAIVAASSAVVAALTALCVASLALFGLGVCFRSIQAALGRWRHRRDLKKAEEWDATLQPDDSSLKHEVFGSSN